MVFNATFNNISVILWRSVLLVEETGENHQLSQVTNKLLSHTVECYYYTYYLNQSYLLKGFIIIVNWSTITGSSLTFDILKVGRYAYLNIEIFKVQILFYHIL
jgi:hypothetical protein